MELPTLEKKLEYIFKDQSLFSRALTHRSYLNEHTRQNLLSNERIEFLGDAILELVISKKIYDEFPDFPEGDLTALRSKIVCTKTLTKIADSLDLGSYLLLSKGEDEGGGRKNSSLLANTVESLIGAIYLDSNYENAAKFIENNFYPLIANLVNQNLKDNKSLLQEITQEKEKLTPVYQVVNEEGPDHAKTFTVGVYVGDKKLSEANGRSKQEAEEAAAKLALEKYN